MLMWAVTVGKSEVNQTSIIHGLNYRKYTFGTQQNPWKNAGFKPPKNMGHIQPIKNAGKRGFLKGFDGI